MQKAVGFYRDKKKRVRPITKKKAKSRYNGQTSQAPWSSSSVEDVKRAHARRSRHAQRIDESLRAPIAESPEEWKKQPNRRDVKGVDSPRKRRTQVKQPKEKEANIMAEYSRSPTTKGWKEWREAKVKEPQVAGATSYNKATGWMRISFPDKPSAEVRADMKARGFRYKPRSKTWSAKWTPGRQAFAENLVGPMETVDIEPNWARKAERSAELAEKHERKSDAYHNRADQISSAIPLGQPILVGHHSEKRHRRDLKRIRTNIHKSIEEREIAEKYADRAARFGRKATGENPVTIHNRIKRLEADKRSTEKHLRMAKSGERSIYYSVKPEHREREVARLEKWLQHYNSRLDVERQKYEASGGIPTDKMIIKTGDRVKTRWGRGTVGRVSQNTVRVKLDPMDNGREVGIYMDRKGYSKLDKTDIYSKVE